MKTATNLRRSGIDVVGDVPWGTHICQFYETKEDLTDVLVPYFKAGLESNELCIWVTSWPLEVEDAKTSLRKAKSDLDDYLGKGQIDILDYRGWYVRSGKFDADDVLKSWAEKEKMARERGFRGLRISGNISWLDSRDWGDFQNYETRISEAIGKYRMIAVCSYHVDRCSVSDLLEVVNNHESALFRREKKWALRDSPGASRVRHELASSELRYRRLFEAAQDGILILDRETAEITDVNPCLEEMLGYSDEQLLGKRLWEIGPFKDIELGREAFQELQSSGCLRYEHLPLETENGQRISVEFVSNVYSVGGEEVIQCNIRDITERVHSEEELRGYRGQLEKRVEERTAELEKVNRKLKEDIAERKNAEEALKESEEKWRSLVENAPVGIVVSSIDGRVLELNTTLPQMHGYESKEEFAKSSFSDRFCDPKDRERWVALVQTTGKVEGYEMQTKRKDGSSFWASLTAVSRTTEKGEQQLITVSQDITERKQAEEGLLFKSALLEAQAETTVDGILVVDERKKIVFSNKRFQEMWHVPQELIDSKDDTPLFAHVVSQVKDAGAFARRVKYLYDYREEKSFEEGEMKDGRVFERYSAPLMDANGLYRGRIWYFRDITERKKNEMELQKAEKLESISTLAGGIAHDFNNLLTGIMGNITLAQRYVEKGGKVFDWLVDAERASMRARDLTLQLLTFSRGGAPTRKPVSIAVLLRESASFVLSGSNVKCNFCLPHDLWAAEVDKEQIGRVVANVVINAEQAMPQGGTIRVKAENLVIKRKGRLPLRKGKYLKISINDRGTGIPKQHLSRIFEPYFTTKQKGSGLGLAIAYSIVKNHGGYMSAESELGVGTTIYIYIPATTKPVSAKEEIAEEVYIVGGGRILVMDDEEMIRDLLRNSLSEVGYEIELAGDGAEAIKKYAEAEKSGRRFDAVILDLTVRGGMGGKDTIKKLLELDPNVKAIASSGYANNEVLAKFEKYGFSGVVAKPYNIGVLEKTLRDVIHTSESEKAAQKGRQVKEDSGTGSARILVMDDAQAVTVALGENLPDLGFEVEFARNSDEAISKYSKALESGHSFDVVLMDLNISGGPGGEETIHRLVEIDPEIRAIVSSGYPAEPSMRKPEKFGFRAAIAKPYRIEELGEVLRGVIEGEN